MGESAPQLGRGREHAVADGQRERAPVGPAGSPVGAGGIPQVRQVGLWSRRNQDHNLQSATVLEFAPQAQQIFGSGELPLATGRGPAPMEPMGLFCWPTHPPGYQVLCRSRGSIARRGAAGSGASATGAGSRQYRGQGPEQPAAFPLCRIYQSIISSRGRRLQGARATTARYGRVSASAGQGARARCGRWPEGAGTGRTSGKPGRCRGAPSGEISGGLWSRRN